MKIRNGFVSNSSSSSFIIALPTKTKCKHCGKKNEDMLWVIHDILKTVYEKENCDGANLPKYGGVAEYLITSMAEEVKSLKKDIYWCNKEKKILEKALKNKDAMNIYERLDDLELHRIPRHSREFEAVRKRYSDSAGIYDSVSDRIHDLEKTIASAGKKISNFSKKARLVNKAVKNDDTVFVFNLDNASEYRNIIDRLIENGHVTLIDREST